MSATIQSGLYGITDPELLPGEQLFSGVEAALRGGAVLIQYRDKTATPTQRSQRAARLIELCRVYGCPLIINDDYALAQASGAAGVHMGQGDGSLTAARGVLGPDKLLGATCHSSISLAQEAAAAGANYLAFGRFYGSRTKQQAPAAALSVLTDAQSLGLPIVAIGGLTLANAEPVITAGADLLAVVHGLFAAPDIEARARQFSQLIQDVRASRAK